MIYDLFKWNLYLSDPKLGFDDLIKLPEAIASNMSMKDLIMSTFPDIKTE
jgi:hypothetical protein